jgi:hypothetical protein
MQRPQRRREARRWSVTLDRKTENQLRLEGIRQDLRDQRWRRVRSKILTATGAVAMLLGSVGAVTGERPIHDVIAALLKSLAG